MEKNHILLTYRCNITPLFPSTYYDSDTGWGCMLRVAQMFIANLLFRRLDWSYFEVLKLFIDNVPAAFNLQSFTNTAATSLNKKKFEWYSPSEVGFLIKEMLEKVLLTHRVSIGNDNCLFLKEIEKDREGCVVLIMCRLGLDAPQKEYLELVIRLSQTKYFAGILGGKPRHAYFFVSHQGKKFRFLDPHKTLKAISSQQELMKKIGQFQEEFKDIDENLIDPSMCIAFQFPTKEIGEFWNMLLELKKELKDRFFLYVDEAPPEINQFDVIEFDDDVEI